jgi:hypothetical protein
MMSFQWIEPDSPLRFSIRMLRVDTRRILCISQSKYMGGGRHSERMNPRTYVT